MTWQWRTSSRRAAVRLGWVLLAVWLGATYLSGAALSGTLAHQLDWVQAYSFMLFTLLYTPCLATVATLQSESKQTSFTALSLVWSLVLAWLVSFGFYQGARALGY